jgi:predicted DNA-binding transcriptional regulator AlpA
MTRLHKAAEPSQPVYLSTDQVLARYGGVSRMWIHRRQKRDGFPKAIHFGSSPVNYWRLTEVRAWEKATGHDRPNRRVRDADDASLANVGKS